ncbi:MAG TPA: MFS transporter [Streptosporangiaceae bacterium]|nr:MFS transporter [Streptosporangiaceae bacterium]
MLKNVRNSAAEQDGERGESTGPPLGGTAVNNGGTGINKAAGAVNRIQRGRSRIAARIGVLGERNFRLFFAGYATSLLGTSMASVALVFAVLDAGGSAATLGYVLAAGIAAQVVLMLAAGVMADRLGRRPVMLAADAARCCAQIALAAAVLSGRPPTWAFVLLAGARGAGDAFFTPSLSGLTVQIAARDQLGNANALLSTARAGAAVAGPALAGILVALAGPGPVIGLDAGSYAISVVALALLRFPSDAEGLAQGVARAGGARAAGRLAVFGRELADGWAEFRGRRWLVVTTVQFTLFNLFTWGPFLLLGPVLSEQARGWGIIMACYGAGSVLGGVLALGRRPRRLVAAATVATFGYGVPCWLMAFGAQAPVIAAGALVAGLGSALGGAFAATAEQQQVPAQALARVSAFQTVFAFSFGPLAFAAAGPVAAVVGARAVLGFGAAWATVSSAVVLAMPSVRAVRATWAAPDRRRGPVRRRRRRGDALGRRRP